MDLTALGRLNGIVFRISIWTQTLYELPGGRKRHLVALKRVVFTASCPQ